MRSPSAKGFGILIACSAMIAYAAACSAPASSGDVGQTTSPTTGAPAGNNNGAANSNNGSSNTGDSNGSSSSNGSGSGSSSSSSSSDPEAGAAATGDMACAAMAEDACGTCCENNHPSGSDVYDTAWTACMCGAKGACQTECAATDCSTDDNAPYPTPGDACDTCEQKASPGDGSGQCDAPINTACDASADCMALNTCYNACP